MFLRLRGGGGGRATGLGTWGHWKFVAPVYVGDTPELRHRPVSVRGTRTDPSREVVTFGLQLVSPRQRVVQQGEVDMMLDIREGFSDA